METHEPALPPGPAEGSPKPEPDLSSMPPIDSIGAATDITAFLRKGVPRELSRAALRRAWTADPAIRDFVGLAENAWDFNDPNAMPGFGPLDCSAEQLDALVGRIVGGVQQPTEQLLPSAEAENIGRVVPERDPASSGQETNSTEPIVDLSAANQATMQLAGGAELRAAIAAGTEREQTPVRHRAHGSALPRE
jgi:hypothetical protein